MEVVTLFDLVPECIIETLLIVHGSGDRNSSEFTQVCDRWTCILASLVRTLKTTTKWWLYEKEYARCNGNYYKWHNGGRLQKKGVSRIHAGV